MEEEPLQFPRYEDLAAIADPLLEECDEDIAALAEHLDRLPAPARDALLESDFLNALQVFYYHFRLVPGEIEAERLMLVPASELQYGIRISEVELLEIIVAVTGGEPQVVITDGENSLARFTGRNAYRDGLAFIESTL